MRPYRPRHVDPLLARMTDEHPAVLLVGPRACGKTTSAARLARSVVHLDRPREAAAFEADPDSALVGLEEPILLDEWQAVPGVLGAVKRAVDEEPRPGRFLITGSVRGDLDGETWPGTGRLVRLQLQPMTVGELLGSPLKAPWMDRVVQGALGTPRHAPALREYTELAVRGGFPEAAWARSPDARARWLEGYVDQLLTRDVAQIDAGRDPVRLRRYMEALALNSAGLATEKTLCEAAGINAKTASAYERLMVNLQVLSPLPAWTSNRLKRLSRAPKRHLVDASLVAGTLRADADTVLRDGDLLGRILETLVAAHLRADAQLASSRPQLFHFRDAEGRHEVDFLAELGGQRVVGIEVKASSAPREEDARHLAWLRDHLGAKFVAGVVLHTGPRVYAIGERLVAAPISTLWS